MPDHGLTDRLFYLTPTESKPVAADRNSTGLIVERARAGDAEAFGQLYKMFSAMVHGIVLARVRRDEVDDIVQDIFVSAFNSLGKLREPEAFGGWLTAIARIHTAKFYRNERPSEELPETLSANDERTSEAREILQKIRSLPDTYRETLILRLVEGMTGPEIAESTGMTPDSVRVNLHRGMKMLREKLGVKPGQDAR